jgi:hypothetical protein
MHLSEPYVASQADHLGRVTITIDDRDGTEPNTEMRVEMRLMDADGHQVADRSGQPDHMPAEWKAQLLALLQEFRVATALIHDISAAPPDDEE